MSIIAVTDITSKMRGSLFKDTRALTAVEYNISKINSALTAPVEFSTMLLAVSLRRANSVEGEVLPVSTAVTDRNSQLEELGKALSAASADQARTQKESPAVTVDADDNTTIWRNAIKKYQLGSGSFLSGRVTPGDAAQAVQLLKSHIDNLNNEAQADMTRLQSLVDKRDEAYNLGSDLVGSVSDSRSTAIRNIG